MCKKNVLYSIQSLKDESETGKELIENSFDGLCDFKEKKLFPINTKDELFQTFKEIQKKIDPNSNDMIFLSLDMHGSDKGLQLTDSNNKRTDVSWEEIIEDLVSINKSSHMHLILMMSSCYGGEFIEYSGVYKKGAPYYFFFGPKDRTIGSHILSANIAIIKDLFDGDDIAVDEIISNFNDDCKKNHHDLPEYIFSNAYDLFIHIFTKEMNKIISPLGIAQIVKEKVKDSLQSEEKFEDVKGDLFNNLKKNFNKYFSKQVVKDIFTKWWEEYMFGREKFLKDSPLVVFNRLWEENNAIQNIKRMRMDEKFFQLAIEAYAEEFPNFAID